MDVHKEYRMFSDVWKFYKKYRIVENEIDYWEDVIRDGQIICRRYKDRNLLCVKLILAIIEYYEEVGREKAS